ncbi:MAG TPA: helix-hairpin-helix domain-containing protein [Tepidisphaeraceae bacterium]|nr:helix-hairpin-helix domain-containing protein [Tepidisphaeraceae bacterium]
MSGPDSDAGFIWTPAQRRALLALLTVLLVCLGGRYACNRTFIDDPQPDVAARAGELADKLDPNTADWQELAAIPNLGQKKAKAIVAFREQWLTQHPGNPPFHSPQDLRQVKGIGPATASNMMPYLIFPNASPISTTRALNGRSDK